MGEKVFLIGYLPHHASDTTVSALLCLTINTVHALERDQVWHAHQRARAVFERTRSTFSLSICCETSTPVTEHLLGRFADSADRPCQRPHLALPGICCCKTSPLKQHLAPTTLLNIMSQCYRDARRSESYVQSKRV